MKRTMFVLVAVVMIMATVMVAGCGSGEKPAERVSIAVCEEYSTLVWIAQDQGYFADNGLNVAIRDYKSGKQACDALLAGEVSIATSADFVLVSNSFDYQDLRTFGVINTVDNIELVARKDHGISQPDDLKGKKIGVTLKSTAEFFLGSFLIFNKLSTNDVEFIDLNPNEIIEAIVKGDIDAAFTWQPNISRIKSTLRDNAISWPGQCGQPYYFLLITRESWITEHAKTAERFIKAITQAEEYTDEYNNDAKNLIKQRYGYESSYLDVAWSKHEFRVTLAQQLLVVLEDQARWRIKQGLNHATEVPNYLDYIYLDALEAIKPEAISIIR